MRRSAAGRVRLAPGSEAAQGVAGGPLRQPGQQGRITQADSSRSDPYLVSAPGREEGWYGEGALEGALKEVALAMLQAHPAAAAARDGKGTLPLHTAIVCNAPTEVVLALLAAHPAAAAEKGEKGMMLLQVALQDDAAMEILWALLAAHPLSLHAMVENDKYADLVFDIVKRDRSLANASVDPQGRPALHLATGRCKRRLFEALFLLGRYELLNASNPKHRSATARAPPPAQRRARCARQHQRGGMPQWRCCGQCGWLLTASLPPPLAVPGLVCDRPRRGRRGQRRPGRGAEADAPRRPVPPRAVIPR